MKGFGSEQNNAWHAWVQGHAVCVSKGAYIYKVEYSPNFEAMVGGVG